MEAVCPNQNSFKTASSCSRFVARKRKESELYLAIEALLRLLIKNCGC